MVNLINSFNPQQGLLVAIAFVQYQVTFLSMMTLRL